MNGLTIGAVAKRAGLGVETIRFYEKEGLIDSPARTAANYRIYSPQVVTRLQFIKRAKDLGFTLREVSELLTLRQDPHAMKKDVKHQVEAKIADIDGKIRDLRRIRDTLASLDKCCDGEGSADDCPILKALETETADILAD